MIRVDMQKYKFTKISFPQSMTNFKPSKLTTYTVCGHERQSPLLDLFSLIKMSGSES